MRAILVLLVGALGSSVAAAQSGDARPTPPSVPSPAANVTLRPRAAEPYLPRGYRRAGAAPDTDGRARVHVLALGDDELTLHSRPRGSRAPFAALCTAPCTLRLDPGAYELAVAPSGGGPRMADDQPVTLERGRAAIQMHYDHRSGLRVLGWTFFSIGATSAGLSIGFSALFGGWAPLIAAMSGGPITFATWVPFFILAFLTDSARVQVTPLDD